MDYILISISVLCIGVTFALNKLYQIRVIKKISHLLIFPLCIELITVPLFLAINGFRLSATLFGVIMAALYAFLIEAYTIIGMVAVKYGKLSIYTMFLMVGGMLLPYFYGVIFLHESLTVCRIIGIVVLLFSLILNGFCSDEKKAKTNKIFWICCVLVFILNGFVSIVSKAHQINSGAIGIYDFIVWTGISKIVFSGIALSVYAILCRSKLKISDQQSSLNRQAEGEELKTERFNFKLFFVIIAVYAVVNGLSTVCMLEAAKTLPATAQYPFVTGGATIITAIIARLVFKEKISRISLISLAIMFGGTILFLF